MTSDKNMIALMAMRYSLGRRTFAPTIAQNNILDNIGDFQIWELETIIRDIDETLDLGDDNDVIQWEYFKNKIKGVINNETNT